jgi:hypothetical protein
MYMYISRYVYVYVEMPTSIPSGAADREKSPSGRPRPDVGAASNMAMAAARFSFNQTHASGTEASAVIPTLEVDENDELYNFIITVGFNKRWPQI